MDSELMNLTSSVGVWILCPALCSYLPSWHHCHHPSVSSLGNLRYDTHDVFPSVAFLLNDFWEQGDLFFSHPEDVDVTGRGEGGLRCSTV